MSIIPKYSSYLFGILLLLGIALGSCQNGDNSETVTLPAQACQAVAFYPAQNGRAFIRFTDQQKGDLTLRDSNKDGVLEALFTGEPGAYNYLVFQDGSSFLDPYNTRTGYSFNYNREVSQLIIPPCHQPAVTISTLIANKENGLWLAGQWYTSAEGDKLVHESLKLTIDGQKGLLLTIEENGSFVVKVPNISIGKHTLTINGRDDKGHQATEKKAVFWIEEEPFDWQDSNIYQIVLDRFANENGELPDTDYISSFHGGNLKGLISKLKEGYFDQLGVNVIWLSPLYQNPAGRFLGRDGFYAEPYHGYWPLDMRNIDRRFGNADELHEFIALAHAKGIRVILDSVLNHTHIQNIYFVNHSYDGWYNNTEESCICGVTCDWGAHYEDCWFDPFLADLSWEKEEQMQALVDDHIYWLETFDLDGLRMDAVPMMPRRAMRRMRSAIEEHFDPAGEHIFLLGENYTSRGEQPNIRYYLGPHTLSGLFDFPVMWAIRQVLGGIITAEGLNNEIIRSEKAWEGSGAIMGMFLGNHDVPRFISAMNNDELWEPRYSQPAYPTSARPYNLLKFAWTLIYTLPGAPVIYYGDEVAMPGANDPDNRRDMRFNNLTVFQQDVLDHVQKVSQMRNSCQALRRGQRKTIFVNDDFYVFARYLDDQLVLVAMNFSSPSSELTIDLPKSLVPTVPATFKDPLTGESFTLSSSIMKLNIDQSTIKVLALSGSCGE